MNRNMEASAYTGQVPSKRFQRELADNVAQRVGVPLPPAQDRLLAPRAWIAGRFRPHPTRLVRLVAQQSIEKLPRRGRDPLLNSGRMRCLASRNDVSSTDAPPIIRSRIMVTHGFRTYNQLQL
jgi:hypothetical protein